MKRYEEIYNGLMDNTVQIKEELETLNIPFRPGDDVQTAKLAALIFTLHRQLDLDSRISTIENKINALEGYVKTLWKERGV